MQVPRPLAEGSVRVWHIVFLYFVIFISTAIAGTLIGRTADPSYRVAWTNMVTQGLIASAILVLSVIVPELRRSIRGLYRPSVRPLSAIDALLFVAVMWTWSLGASRMLLVLPALQWHPELYSLLGYREQYEPPGAIFLALWLVASVVIAPFAEELFFRGFLQNLVHARWGVWPAILISSFVFGTAHLVRTPIAMVAGIFLSLVYLRAGSLWPGTLLHALYNLSVTVIATGPMFFVKPKEHVASLSSWTSELFLTIAFVPLVYLFWRRFKPAT